MSRRIFICIPLLIAALAAGGCTLAKPLSHHAVSYNLAVESAQNRMLFLNVLRASQRMPMYFTDIGSITAGLSYDMSAGGGTLMASIQDTLSNTGMAESKGVDTESASLTLPSVSYANKPTMEISVLDDQDFMRGTLTPISPKIIAYLLNQGWNQEVVLNLLVERIEMQRDRFEKIEPLIKLYSAGTDVCTPLAADSDASTVTIDNDPEDARAFACFSAYLRALHIFGCRLSLDHDEWPILGYLAPTSTVADILKAREADTRIIEVSETRSALTELDPALHVECPVSKTVEGVSNVDLAVDMGIQRPPGSDGKTTTTEDDENDDEVTDERREPARDASIALRSPQGVLYYLGEVTRVWTFDPEGAALKRILPMVHVKDDTEQAFPCPDEGGETCVPLFLARKPSADCSRSLVEMTYDENTYIIPKLPAKAPSGVDEDLCHPGRSMQALTLVSQLLSLQKKGQELPGPALVRVVGN